MHGTTANMSGLNFLQKLEEFLTLDIFFIIIQLIY